MDNDFGVARPLAEENFAFGELKKLQERFF